ncbi:MAG: hypothetical protein ACOC4B_03525, partial [Bacteroidota bacterium]
YSNQYIYENVKKNVIKLEELKIQEYHFPAISNVIEQIHLFMNYMLEELDTPISNTTGLVKICFKQLELITDITFLLNKNNELPAYIEHIIREVFSVWKRYYQEKINFLQVEFMDLLELDKTQGNESRIYINFCNKILNITIEYDWLTYKKNIINIDNDAQINEFYYKYFSWQQIANQNFDHLTADEKARVTQINSAVRSAVKKMEETDNIGKIVKELPEALVRKDFKEIHHHLVWEKNIFQTVSYLPLNQYYETYDYLIDSYVDKFDIDNASESIASFSTKYPKYVQWFTDIKVLRKITICLVTLLFLMGAFDPNIYEFDGEDYRPPVPELFFDILGENAFAIISGSLQAFWTAFIGIAFFTPIIYIVISFLRKVIGTKKSYYPEDYGFINILNKINGKSKKFLYAGFIIPLLLVVIQMAKPGTINMINHFEGLRLISTVIIIFMLTIYSIYLDIKERNPLKPDNWVISRTNHMFWLYSLQSMIITIFVIDFLLRFQINLSMFEDPQSLVTAGISRYVVLQFEWFDVVIMPLFTIIISFLTLFFSFFINRIFK